MVCIASSFEKLHSGSHRRYQLFERIDFFYKAGGYDRALSLATINETGNLERIVDQ
tara:strand:+ start:327 stop:494 length:168 start_codon:yes stop_codon:yes gene_type:complete